jgi:hypothetical protein
MKYILLTIGLLSLYGAIAGSEEPILSFLVGTPVESLLYAAHIGNNIVSNLSVGLLVSIFFWYIVVYLPERNRRKIIRNNLAAHYQDFKENTIQILLWASIGTHEHDLPKKFCNYKEFKEFFSINSNQNWYTALNGIQGNEGYLNDIIVEIELLQNEVSYVLNNVDIGDEKIHSFLKRLSTNVHKLKNSSVYTADHVKYLGNFLWGILAQWSFIDGQREDDIIEIMISKI